MNSKEVLTEIRSLLGFSTEEPTTSVEMATATLTDGSVIEYEGELAVGTAIFVQTAEGNIPAPDATHEVEGGLLVTTEGGFVTEIVEPEVEIEIEAEEFATVSAFNDTVSKLESAIAELTNEQSTDLLVKALFGSKTSSTLQSANQVQVGVKSASALNILASTVFFQADGCGYNPSGTTAFTQRNITVGSVKVEETLCPKTLEAKWMQTQIMPGSPTMIPFEEQVGAEKAAVIAQTLEVAMWQGDTTSGNPNLSRFDGFNKIIAAASPVLANSAPTTFTSITAANIDDILDQVYANIPAAVAEKDDLVCFLGIDAYKLMLVNLKNANLFHYVADAAQTMEMVYPGTNMKLIAVGGLNGTNKIVAGSLSNFFMGTDLIDEQEEVKMWYSIDNDEVRVRFTFKAGVQVAFPGEIVYFTL